MVWLKFQCLINVIERLVVLLLKEKRRRARIPSFGIIRRIRDQLIKMFHRPVEVVNPHPQARRVQHFLRLIVRCGLPKFPDRLDRSIGNLLVRRGLECGKEVGSFFSSCCFICGIGASGPQVVEGWYGQPYPRPLERTREYVDIMRQVWAREAPVEFHGNHYDIPVDGGMNLGKALKPTVHPLRSDIPIYLAAEGPKNVALSAEIADGWLPLFFSPKEDGWYREQLQKGFDASGDDTKKDRFEVSSCVMIIPGDDVQKCADMVRPFLALYAGGMGAKGANFHYEVFERMGYGDVTDKVQNLYLDGKKDEAAASIPLEMVEDVALVGPADKIKGELDKWRETCITEFLLSGPSMMLPIFADLING